MLHESVLLKEVIDGLDLQKGDIYLDATLGAGGHMQKLWEKWGKEVCLLGIDVDSISISIARERLDLLGAKPSLAVLNFKNIEQAPQIFEKRPTKILFDLGWRKDQFETLPGEVGRGFSFQKDEPLLMTFASEVDDNTLTAYQIVNEWQESSLADVIYGYGEERFAKRIAAAIVTHRQSSPIKSSLELAEIIKSAVPIFYRFGRIHPATKTFQAIRIAVNDELRALESGLQKAFEILTVGGRLAVISFHSLEDRIVKNFFRTKVEDDRELINKKPITPTEAEIAKNPRSRSAKLRILKKLK
jgi:16S rRNA (cytosine1402-N4)-methyltransferase